MGECVGGASGRENVDSEVVSETKVPLVRFCPYFLSLLLLLLKYSDTLLEYSSTTGFSSGSCHPPPPPLPGPDLVHELPVHVRGFVSPAGK